jgi:hypothetical protein
MTSDGAGEALAVDGGAQDCEVAQALGQAGGGRGDVPAGAVE